MSQVAEPGVLKVAIARRSSLVGSRGRENMKESLQVILAKDWPKHSCGEWKSGFLKIFQTPRSVNCGLPVMGIDRMSSWAWGCCEVADRNASGFLFRSSRSGILRPAKAPGP